MKILHFLLDLPGSFPYREVMSMQKIAQITGVSIATVSRVINGHANVSANLREKVQTAMEQVGYEPKVPQRNQNATVRTGYVALLQVGLSREWLRRPSMLDLVNGTVKALAEHDLQLVLPYMSDPEKLPPMVTEARLDGVLVLGRASPRIRPKLQRLNAILLLGGVYRMGESSWADWITPDYLEIGRLAVEYFLDRGHRHIAYMNPIPLHTGHREIAYAFASCAQDAGIEPLMLIGGPQKEIPIWDPRQGFSVVAGLVDRLLSEPENRRPTGLLVTDEEIVFMVYDILRGKGLRPGRDLEVITKTHDPRQSFRLQPRPVTITVDHEEIARRAVEKLIYRMKRPDAPVGNRTLILPHLRVEA